MRAIVIAGMLMIGAAACAQAPAGFAAASIRPNASGGGGMGVQVLPGGRFAADNITFKAGHLRCAAACRRERDDG
jgi:hypothetical protein